MKKSSKCGTISSKCNFKKDVSTKDGLNFICKVCTIGYYNNKQEQRIQNNKFYAKQNRVRKNLYEKNHRKSNLKFKLACNLRSRTKKAFKSQNVEKVNKTFDFIGCSQSFSKRWILYQLYGDMTEENYGETWCLDHCYPLSKTNLFDKKEMNKSTNWIKFRPRYCTENISKGDKIDHGLYLMQELKA